MRELITYNDRRIVIKGYTGAIERDLILYKFSRESDNPPKLSDLLFILEECIQSNIPLEQLSNDEKLYIIYALRGLSVSDTLTLNFDCPNCNEKFKLNYEISKLMTKGKDFNCKYLRNLYSDNAEDYIIPEVLDKLSFRQYDILEKYIEKHKTKFNFIHDANCINCKEPFKVDLRDLEILTSVFSNYDIQGFYNSVNALVYYGRYDISSLLNVVLPFERELITALIQTEIDKDNEAKMKAQGLKKTL